MPTGFLEDLAARFEQEGLDSMLGPTGMRCSAARHTSPVLIIVCEAAIRDTTPGALLVCEALLIHGCSFAQQAEAVPSHALVISQAPHTHAGSQTDGVSTSSAVQCLS